MLKNIITLSMFACSILILHASPTLNDENTPSVAIKKCSDIQPFLGKSVIFTLIKDNRLSMLQGKVSARLLECACHATSCFVINDYLFNESDLQACTLLIKTCE